MSRAQRGLLRPAKQELSDAGALRGGADIGCMQLLDLPTAAFDKQDRSPDLSFYYQPRLVTHIDGGAIAAVTRLYAEILPPGGRVLDLMSSWVSHLPEDVAYGEVVGHGMNATELAANPRLSQWFVQDLNADPSLKLDDASFDAACICVSVQYLQQPMAVFAELARVLCPGAPLIVSFSNRCFPTKAVAIWRALAGQDQQRLVAAYMQATGFTQTISRGFQPAYGDPLLSVVGRNTVE